MVLSEFWGRLGKSAAAAIFLASLLVAPTALGQSSSVLDDADADVIADVARGFGSIEVRTTDSGAPFLVGRMDGVRYGILFYGCANGRDCERIQFAASFGGFNVDAGDMNDWNVEKLIGRAFLASDGDAVLDFVVNLERGVTRDNFDRTFSLWRVALQEFVEFLRAR